VEVKNVRAPAGQAEPAGESKEANKNRVMMVNGSANISELVAGLNEMGATSEDLISVLKSLKASGALLAELEVL
jgi:flagellar P-ring protein precursor FlgI